MRIGSAAMISARSFSLIDPQRAISSSVRPQPEQSPVPASMVQIFTQGVESIFELTTGAFAIPHYLSLSGPPRQSPPAKETSP